MSTPTPQALDMRRRLFGEFHLDVALSAYNLGNSVFTLRRVSEAEVSLALIQLESRLQLWLTLSNTPLSCGSKPDPNPRLTRNP